MASKHIGEVYVLGARAPKDNPLWRGPWDCAEFASWLVYQASGELFGCTNNEDAPSLADAFTGCWGRDATDRRCIIDIDHAARTVGAFVLRLPQPEGVGTWSYPTVAAVRSRPIPPRAALFATSFKDGDGTSFRKS